MDTSAQVAVEQTTTRSPWRYLLFIVVLTAVVTPFAGAFRVPIGPASHVQLPGVLSFLALAVACCVAFMRCPSRPRWGKIAALVLSLPALYLAVDNVMMYLAFGWRR
jgi:hypothetical protein